jgi:HlyD family secretion protein
MPADWASPKRRGVGGGEHQSRSLTPESVGPASRIWRQFFLFAVSAAAYPVGSSPRHLLSIIPLTGRERSMNPLALLYPSRNLFAPVAATVIALASAFPSFAADNAEAPKDGGKGATVTVLKAAKFCFPAIVEASGIIIPREEIMVRPDRPGLKVAEILAEPGDSVTAGQNLARLTPPEGGTIMIQATIAGLISGSTALIGSLASPRGEALFSIIARSEFDFVGMVPTQYISKLGANQTAKVKIVGAGEVDGKVRRVSATVEPNSQLGQVFVAITTNRKLLVNSSGRAQITTGKSCGVSVPLTAVLYGSAGTVVQVVRRAHVETKRVELGLIYGAQVEIKEGLQEGDIVVARAGALLREGDPVRPVMATAETN